MNTLLNDIPFLEANHVDKNLTVIHHQPPKAYWRKLYQGAPPSKPGDNVIDPIGTLEARSMIDAKSEELYGLDFSSYRTQEARVIIEALKRKAVSAFIYGDIKNNPDGIYGLAPRYAFKDGPNVVDAGGSGSECASIWLVAWGRPTVHGIYPQGSKVGLSHKPLPEADYPDPDGNMFRAVGDQFSWRLGLSVRDWRCVARVCNIDVSKLDVNLPELLLKAMEMILEKRQSAIIYMNSELLIALESQALKSGIVPLLYGEALGLKDVPIIYGLPVRQVDELVSTEEALPAKPGS